LNISSRTIAPFIVQVSTKVDENLLRLLPVDNHSMIPDLQWPNQLPPLTVNTGNSRGSAAATASTSNTAPSGNVPATAPGSSSGSGSKDSSAGSSEASSSKGSSGSDQPATAAPPAPAPGPERPGVKILEKGIAGHTNPITGCVDVAESIHCPPKHPIDPSLIEAYDLPVGIGYGG